MPTASPFRALVAIGFFQRIGPIGLAQTGWQVVDDDRRLQETLLHELCHAAAWVVDGVRKPPHGAAFYKWGERASTATGLPVTRCHTYEIQYKHTWSCVGHRGAQEPGVMGGGCGAVIGRHSRSIDPAKHVCGRCKGVLEYTGKTGEKAASSARKAKAGPFAVFVKEQYEAAKRAAQETKREQL